VIWGVVGYGAALGLFFHAADFAQARLTQRLATEARAWVEQHRHDPVPGTQEAAPSGTVWYVGHWGFQFYAEQQGMRITVPPYTARDAGVPLPPPSRFRKGDWLVVPDWRIHQQGIAVKGEPLSPVCHLQLNDGWPLQTGPCYYCGAVAIEHRAAATRLEAIIFRVTDDFSPWVGPGGFAP
jgi:hypothetical protein